MRSTGIGKARRCSGISEGDCSIDRQWCPDGIVRFSLILPGSRLSKNRSGNRNAAWASAMLVDSARGGFGASM